MNVESLESYKALHRSFKGARILVVDDEVTIRMILRQFLENFDFTVTDANSGMEAIRLLDNGQFDLILLDVLMPDMSGLDVLKTVRQKYSISKLPIIMVTVNEESADMVKALSLGANDYVVKPIAFNVLRARIDTHLSYSRSEYELREARAILERRVEERTAELRAVNESLEKEVRDRIQVEEALRESHKFLNAIIEEAPDFISARDLDGRYTVINNAAARALGLAVTEIIGKTNFDLLSPEIASRLDEEDKKVLTSGSTHSFEQSLEIEGNHRIILTTEYVHRDEKGILKGILSIGRDITEQKLAEEKIRHQANHDELTGLPTLRLGKDRLSSAIALARRNKIRVAILFLDMDGFKEVNDTLGHKAGDQVLKEVAERLTLTVRGTDTVARLGGDEFVIVITEIAEEQGHVRAAIKIIDSLTQTMVIDGQNINISASIGIALYPEHGETTAELIQKADEAMYVAKNNGKNNYSIA
ncbi:MAG: diguanylate cyclase (GGDEF)-like protein/PAS domain S-box-containing protein [Planctomycetota bacterium]|jgi:diguanylate cyclase (GGDEF)-like protein/PAS domain S-box-containing protein